jgi:hypothetical protein
MNRKNRFFTLSAAVALTLSGCSGLQTHNNPGGGGGGSATVSFVMVSDTPTTMPSVISFRVRIDTITLTSSTGTQTTFSLNGGAGIVVDLMRIQSDSAFLGALANVPTGTNSSITVSFASPVITLFNNSGAAITNVNPTCANLAICEITVASTGSPVITVSQPISGNAGFGIDVNLSNIISLKNGALTLTFANSGTTNAVSSFTLPRTGSNRLPGQFDIIEDITGVVTINGNNVTITPDTNTGRTAITAATTAAMILDKDPSGTLCANPTPGNVGSCVSNNQAASMDAILNSDGTLVIREIEPLLGTLQDTVEGTVVAISSPTQFGMVIEDLTPAATSSLIGSLRIGDPLTVNLSNVKPFLADTKGLPIASSAPGILANFVGATDTTPLRPGQVVAVHVTTFNSTVSPIAANVDTVTLRWSRFFATPAPPFNSTSFNLTGFPPFMGSSTALADAFPGTPTTQNVTNFDGIVDASALDPAKLVAVRTLFIENSTNTASPAFFAAKVRQH